MDASGTAGRKARESMPAHFGAVAALTIHDVKNRLAALVGRAEARGDADTLAVALDTAAALSRLLVLYRAETGTLALDVDGHAPGDLAADLVRETAPNARCRIECEIGDAPTLWFYDEALIRMVLANALSNALRYASALVQVTVAEVDDWLVFTVRDDGVGFAPGLLADTRASPVSRAGCGLGLELARSVAAMHRNEGRCGEIRLANDGGGVFALRLPR